MTQGTILAEMVLEGDQEFQGSMEETSSSMEEAGDAAADASQDFDQAADSLIEVDNAALAAGGAMVAVGGGMEKTLKDTQDMRAELNQVGVNLGITSDEANSLARSISDATFPLEDVTATMTNLAQAGVESEEEMERLALEMDNVADATGRSAEGISDAMIPALKAMGEDIEDAGDHADTFTFIQQETTMELEEFSSLMEKMGPDLKEMGLGFEESAALIAAMEEEGIQGREAMTRLRQAVNAGAESQEDLADEIGISTDTIEDQSQALADAEGITDEYAEAANETVTTTDRLRQRFSEFQLQAAGVLGPIDALAPALMAAGAAQSLFATINFSAVIPSIVGVMTAMGPLLPILLLIAALAAGAFLAWENNFLGIRDVTEDAIGFITGILEEGVEVVSWSIDNWDKILMAFMPHLILIKKRDEIWSVITGLWDRSGDLFDTGVDRVTDILLNWTPQGIIWQKRDDIMDVITGLPGEMKDAGVAAVTSFADGIKSKITEPVDTVKDMASDVRDHLPFSDAKEGPLADLSQTGPAFMQTLAEGMAQNRGLVEAESEQTAAAMEPGPEAPGATGGGGHSVTVDARIMPEAVKVLGGLTDEARREVEAMLQRLQQDQIREIERHFGRTA